MENDFQVTKFFLKSKRLQIFFCLVQNGPLVILAACIGLRGSSRGSLRCEKRAFQMPFGPVILVKYIAVSVAWSIV